VLAKYYYFVSSLPFLRLGETPPMSSADFLDLSRFHVSAARHEALTQLCLVPRASACCPAEARWNEFEPAVRNAVVRARAARTGREAQAYTKLESTAFGFLETQVQDAFNRDPLRLESELDRVRWEFLDDLTVGRDFDFDALFVYRIKLLLLEKRAALDADSGWQRANESLNQKLEASELPADIAGAAAV
jgi:hypothetical protein